MKKLKGIFTLVIAFAMAAMLNTNVALAAPLDGTAQHDAAYYRNQLSQMFNAKEYAARYPEVVKKVGNSEKTLFKHYLTTGVYNCNESEDLVPDWSARWFTQLVLMTVGDCTGQDVSVLLANYSANQDNYGKLQALYVIFNSMILTGMPPYEMMLASATQVVEVAPGVTLVIIDNPPGGGPSYIIWRTSNTADMTAFAATYVNSEEARHVPEGYELIIDADYGYNAGIIIDAGGKITVDGTATYTLQGSDAFIINGGILDNKGIIDFASNYSHIDNGDGSGQHQYGGTIINDGTINVGNGSTINNYQGQITNNGTINAGQYATLYNNQQYGTFQNNGTINAADNQGGSGTNINGTISGNPVNVQ